MIEDFSRHDDIVESLKLKMATDIAREILNKIEITTCNDTSGDLQCTLSFYMTTSREQAEMINEMMPVIEKLYRACKPEHIKSKEGRHNNELLP
jgi:hypothetical protein